MIANGKTEKAKNIIRKAAGWNDMSYESVMESVKKKRPLMPVEIEVKAPEMHDINNGNLNTEKDDDTNKYPKSTVHKYSAFTILKHRRILVISIMLWFTWYCI